MKRIFAAGGGEETEKICEIFRSIHADAKSFLTVEALIPEVGETAPHLIIIAFDIASKSDLAVQEIRKHPILRSVPLLVYYPPFTARQDMRAQGAGADGAMLFPVERRELLTRSARLLRIDKRRVFKTLLTVEATGRSVMARSEDFSTTGLSFNTDGILDEEEKVRIHLFLPGEAGRISLEAIIARRLPMPENLYFYGASFVISDKEALRKIEEFIDRGK